MAEAPAAGGAAADGPSKEEKKKKKELEVENKLDMKNFADNYPKLDLDKIKVYRDEKFQRVFSIILKIINFSSIFNRIILKFNIYDKI